jgi:urease accessory protein UreF
MAKPNIMNNLIGSQTAYQWLTAQLEQHGTIKDVAAANGITRATIYYMMDNENLEIIHKVAKKKRKTENDETVS